MKKFNVIYMENLQTKEMVIEAYGREDAKRRIREMQKEKMFGVIQLCELEIVEKQRKMIEEACSK